MLVLLLVATATASSQPDNTAPTEKTAVTNQLTASTSIITRVDTHENMAKVENTLQKNKNNKMDNQIIGEEKNIKTASTTYNVNDYDGLEEALSDNQIFDVIAIIGGNSENPDFLITVLGLDKQEILF